MEQPHKSEIRVMSFNIKCKAPDDGENGWEYRKEKTISMIAFHRPDIAGLQEVFRVQLTDLENSLPSCYSWIGVGREDGKEAGEFCPVFYRNDRLRPSAIQTTWLSETPELCGSIGWDGAFPRIITKAIFEVVGSLETFCFCNIHLDHMGREAKKNGTYQLLKLAAANADQRPVIVTGDFNSTREEDVYRIMTGKDGRTQFLYDAEFLSERGHHGPTTTAQPFSKSHKPERIDYIFVSNNVRVIDHAILADHWDGWYPSDHMPVVADIILV